MMIHIEQFNWFDYVLAVIVFLSLILGIKRGFLREIISIITWLAAFFVAILFTNDVAVYVSNFIKSELLANFVSFFALFVATWIVGSIINYIVTKLVQKTGLTIGDRFFGAVFGCVRGILIILLIVFLISVTNFQSAKWYQKSRLTYWLQGVSSWIQDSAIKAVKKVQGNGTTEDATKS
jgi:membrane protein required for colicin V production